MTLAEMREERGRALEECHEINDLAGVEKRELTAEEDAEYGKRWADVESLGVKIERSEKLAEAERKQLEVVARKKEDDAKRTPGGPEDRANLEMACFRGWLATGQRDGEGAEEFRALQADSDTIGGFLVAPQLFIAQLIKDVDDMVFVRGQANVLPPLTSSASIGVPTLDTDIADPDWTTEILTGSEDSSLAFGKREMEPHPLAKLIKVSNTLLRVAALDPESIVRERMTYKHSVVLENNYLNGSGAQQPLGIYTASADGISTGRDVSDGNTTTAIKFDGLISVKYFLKSQYWGRARWNFHRDAMEQISKLKDGDGQYIWRQSVRDGEPDMILGFPVDMSEFTPNTFTGGLYVGALCDWSNYWILDSLQLMIQRLDELYAATNQTGFIMRYEGDGAPVREEAFVRVTMV